MTRKTLIFAFVLSFFCQNLSAQEDNPAITPANNGGQAIFVDTTVQDQDYQLAKLSDEMVLDDIRIKVLLQRYMEINRGISNGYRVQIFSSSGVGSSEQAQKARGKFLNEDFDIPAYLVDAPPYFRVRAGDFRTRLEAQKYRELIRPIFPGAFIVPDKINLPELPEPSN